MKIFISWSGNRSKVLATGLKAWLTDVFQGDNIFMSDHDIEAGTRWSNRLNTELEESNFGIICLTSDNLIAPWLLFEAGALSKTIIGSHVVPYLLNVKPTDVVGPLAQFQGVSADKEGSFKLIQTLNELREIKLSEEKLNRSFLKWWPDMENYLNTIPESKNSAKVERPERDLLEEILELLRSKTTSQIVQSKNATSLPETLFENKSIYEYTQDDLTKMTTRELHLYIEQLNKRYAVTTFLGEESSLESRIQIAEHELRTRKLK